MPRIENDEQDLYGKDAPTDEDLKAEWLRQAVSWSKARNASRATSASTPVKGAAEGSLPAEEKEE